MENFREYAKAWKPLEPTTHGRYRLGGPVWHRRRRHGHGYNRRHPVYVVQEPIHYASPHWWHRYYPTTWYSRWYYEGFQNETKMNCSMLSTLCILVLIIYCLKK
tara:strand:- start:5 stop:316 length:312 start_codon:yes stop_codon:yes gene_type:complete